MFLMELDAGTLGIWLQGDVRAAVIKAAASADQTPSEWGEETVKQRLQREGFLAGDASGDVLRMAAEAITALGPAAVKSALLRLNGAPARKTRRNRQAA